MSKKIKCAYLPCTKKFDKKDAVTVLLYKRIGSHTVKVLQDYCSSQCAEYNQMAHE